MNEPIEINISKNSDKKVERPWGTYEIITKGKDKVLKNKLIHFTFKSLNHYQNKINQYAQAKKK